MVKSKSELEGNMTGNDLYYGYCVDLAYQISRIVNFTYEFRVVKDKKFGAKRIIKTLKKKTKN